MQIFSARPTAKGLFSHPPYQSSFKFTCTDKSSVPFNSTFLKHSVIRISHLNYNTSRWSNGEGRRITTLHPIRLSAAEAAQPSGGTEKWIFQFVGDGSTSHIGQAVSLPSTFELTSDAAIVGRLPEKADIVIPVATVSGLHARLEKKEGILFVTDLNSTNGTYIDDMRLSPDVITPLSPQSCITFGDVHLAKFQFSKLEKDETISKDT